MDKVKTLKILNERVVKDTLMETLHIKFTEVGDDYLVAQMPVNSTTHQPDGVLHGGASVALAESVGSAASHIFINQEDYFVRGIEISANHLKSKTDGIVTATAKPIHKGRTTNLWEIRIEDEEGSLISLCKLTTITLPKKK